MAWKLPPDQNAMGGVYGSQDAPLWLQSGTQEAPQLQPGAHLRNDMPMPHRVGIGESIANALLPRRDEQGMPQAPGVGDFISSALMAIPMGRGVQPARHLPGRQMSNPERIVGSSVVLDGKVWTGPNHGIAVLNAEDHGVNTAAAFKTANRNGWWPGEPNTDGGFITSHGRVVSRQEAADIIEKSRQMTFDPGLESVRAQYKKHGVLSEDISGSLKAKRNEELAQQWNGQPLENFTDTTRMALPPVPGQRDNR